MPIRRATDADHHAPADAGLPTASSDHHARALRWVFRRGEELLSCELRLTELDSAYELRITAPQHPDRNRTELFDDAMPAFQRHAAIERALVEDGWSLESFESHRGHA